MTPCSNLGLQWKSRDSCLFSLDSLDHTVVGIAPGAQACWSQARYLYDSDFQRSVDEAAAAAPDRGVMTSLAREL